MSISNMISQISFLLSFKNTMRTMMKSCIWIIFIIEMSIYIRTLFSYIIVVVTFKNHIEKDIMCELLNLESEKKNYLSIIDEGQCIIRVNSIKKPFLLGIPYIKRNPLTVSEIHRKNEVILDKQQKNSDLVSLDTHKSNNPVICKDSKIKVLIFKTILHITSFRNRLKNDKDVCSKEIDDLDQTLNSDLVDVVNDDENYDFDIYIKKLYMDQEKHK